MLPYLSSVRWSVSLAQPKVQTLAQVATRCVASWRSYEATQTLLRHFATANSSPLRQFVAALEGVSGTEYTTTIHTLAGTIVPTVQVSAAWPIRGYERMRTQLQTR